MRKREYCAILKILKKCWYLLYKTYFILEIDVKTLVAQLNYLIYNLSEALVISWLAWIQLFNFIVRYMSGSHHTAADGLSRRPKVEEKNENEEDINDFINSKLNIVKVLISKVEDRIENILESKYNKEYQRII